MEQDNKMIRIFGEDNVAVALMDLKSGETVTAGDSEITLQQDIPFGHKAALRKIANGEDIIKYGMPIGHAIADIEVGEHIHTHNLKTNLSGILEYHYNPKEKAKDWIPEEIPNTFMGYVRPDGKVGVRNEIWIIPTVGCVNKTAQILEQRAGEAFKDQTDGIFAYTHNMGCSQLGDDHERTQKLLAGLIKNPNAGGVLVLSLGCENNNLETFRPFLGDIDENRIKFLVTQDVEDEYEKGMELLSELVEQVSSYKREEVPVSELSLGFKCGGSDGFSGITANALCGRITDLVTSQGGSSVLTEVPEMFGAETLLMNRAESETVFDKTVDLINNFKDYFTKYNQVIYENPSPGNKKGGVSTLEEKSLGCIQKGGQVPVVDVLGFGEPIREKGLNLLIGPGNDQVSCTNLSASGVQMILFTTGRGNPYGSPVPTVKISSNTALYNHKKHWIDFNAGEIVEGRRIEDVALDFYKYIIDVASGVKTVNETYGYKEISIFRDGVIL